jgi:hypothetical protein
MERQVRKFNFFAAILKTKPLTRMKIEGYFNGHIFETLTPVNPLRAKVSVVRRKDNPEHAVLQPNERARHRPSPWDDRDIFASRLRRRLSLKTISRSPLMKHAPRTPRSGVV